MFTVVIAPTGQRVVVPACRVRGRLSATTRRTRCFTSTRPTRQTRGVTALLRLQGRAMLSCYDHPVYAPLADAGWQRVDWQTACHVAGRTRATGIQGDGAALRMQARTETLWASPGTIARQMELALAV